MKLTYTIFLALLFYSQIQAQYSLEQYSESGNKISLTLKLEPSELLTLDYQNKKIKTPGFYDESKPGELSLLSKSIFVGIPANSNLNFSYSIIEQENLSIQIGLNPSTLLIKDSIIVYDFFTDKRKKNNQLELVKLKGFLWIDNIYCAHFEIAQYNYDYAENIITQVNKIKLDLSLSPEINLNKFSNNEISTINIKSAIINFEAAKKFIVLYPDVFVSDTSDSWIDYSKSYIKIKVFQDGIYRLGYDDILNAGISPSTIDPKSINIYKQGKTLPIFISGENDNSFDQSDFIEFVGLRNMGGKHRQISVYDQPYNEYLDRYSDTTIYWLTWNEPIANRVSVSTNGTTLATTDTLFYYYQAIHYESNIFFDYPTPNLVRKELPFWLENKFWGWYAFGVGIRNNVFKVSDVYPNKDLVLLAKVTSFASDIQTDAHLLSLSLNANLAVYDSAYIDRYEQKVLQAVVSSNLLTEGDNTLVLHSYATQAAINSCYFDWYEAIYPRYLKLASDSLEFYFDYIEDPSVQVIKITNAVSPNYSIWKYGNTFEKYSDYSITNNTLLLNDTIDFSDKFIILSESNIKKPLIEKVKQFVNLRNSQNQADYIVITHPDFLDKAAEYDSFIQDNYNVKPFLVNVEDIYDEYAFGFFNPESIRDFLKSTHSYWTAPLPKNVFIIGGATYDYYGFKHTYTGAPVVRNFVPSFGSPVSDNWFVVWDSTGAYLPQMNIGRIPSTSIAEIDYYFNKHKSYLTQPFDDWNKDYLFFSGGLGDDESELLLLRGKNQTIIDQYVLPPPIGGNYFHFYKTLDPVTNFGPYTNEQIQNAISQGGLFISYLGHSGTETWDNSIVDPAQLLNSRNRYPLITDFGCSTARFAESDVISFSQLFINSEDGQAITYIGNSSLGFTSTSTTYPELFYKRILSENILNISESQKLAKIELLETYGSGGSYQLFALTNHLIGDPIISLPIPDKPNFIVQPKDISFTSNQLTDTQDSVNVSINFFNWGKVEQDSIEIILQDIYQTNVNAIDTVYIAMPLFSDSLSFVIPINEKPGEHALIVNLESQNKIDELYETDNIVSFRYFVASSHIKTLSAFIYENGIDSEFVVLNPSVASINSSLDVEFSSDEEFTSSQTVIVPMDSFYTKINLKKIAGSGRHWVRVKISGDDSFGFTKSFYSETLNDYFINDSVSVKNLVLENLASSNGKISIDTSRVLFGIISAGFNDGKTAVITKDGENFIPGGNVRGHHVCIFNAEDFQFVEYRRFDVFGGGVPASDAYAAFLDSLTSDVFLLVAISDEGTVNSNLKSKLKEFGSIYIDSVVFRSSWAFFGRRGSVIGKMPEAFSRPFEGRVQTDTLIKSIYTEGSFLTPSIGPSAEWLRLNIDKTIPENSTINIKPIGIRSDGTQDTLTTLSISESTIDLSFIDSKTYPQLIINGELNSSSAGLSPQINSFGVEYNSLPELGINYQVVSLVKDTLLVGEDAVLKFNVFNAGESSADSFKVKVEVINPDNTTETISDTKTAINGGSNKFFQINYNAGIGSSDRTFYITIDPENIISEQYEDNNIFTYPFFIKPDTSKPTLNLKIDGLDIIDGDYVSNTPEIKIELIDPSLLPISSPSAVRIFLNDVEVPFEGNENILTYQFNSTNPKVVVTYKPDLEDGEYHLKILGEDAFGNLIDSAGVQRSFLVSSNAKLLYVYNYPNPFSNETYFTFKLTQIPDELKIKVFTIAGRLIKEFSKMPAELNYDFNRIYWDGRDEDGDLIANGVYFYKVIMKKDQKIETTTQKIAVVR